MCVGWFVFHAQGYVYTYSASMAIFNVMYVNVFGPHGVPVLDEGKWSLTEALSTVVEWRRFGLVPAAHSSDQHGV